MQTLHETMVRPTQTDAAGWQQIDSEENATADCKPLSRDEADALIKKLGGMALDVFLSRVLAWQVAAGTAVTAAMGLFTGSLPIAYSALYGAACTVLPAALVVRLVSRLLRAQVARQPGQLMVGLLVLELVKVMVTVGLLLAAPLVLGPPEWVAVVAGFVVTLKVYWLVALMGLQSAKHVKKIGING